MHERIAAMLSERIYSIRQQYKYSQEKLAEKFPECEVTVAMGGQPIYYYLISLE